MSSTKSKIGQGGVNVNYLLNRPVGLDLPKKILGGQEAQIPSKSLNPLRNPLPVVIRFGEHY